MDDADLLAQIDADVAEEHALRARHAGGGLSADERGRLTRLEEHLDQLWDLLRQRRAKRDYGEDPADAHERPTDVVENYRN